MKLRPVQTINSSDTAAKAQKNNPAKLAGTGGVIQQALEGFEIKANTNNCKPITGGALITRLGSIEKRLVIKLLNTNKPLPRRVIEPAIGTSYAPNIIKSLRDVYGLEIVTLRIAAPTPEKPHGWYGVYSLTQNAREKIAQGAALLEV